MPQPHSPTSCRLAARAPALLLTLTALHPLTCAQVLSQRDPAPGGAEACGAGRAWVIGVVGSAAHRARAIAASASTSASTSADRRATEAEARQASRTPATASTASTRLAARQVGACRTPATATTASTTTTSRWRS